MRPSASVGQLPSKTAPPSSDARAGGPVTSAAGDIAVPSTFDENTMRRLTMMDVRMRAR